MFIQKENEIGKKIIESAIQFQNLIQCILYLTIIQILSIRIE